MATGDTWLGQGANVIMFGPPGGAVKSIPTALSHQWPHHPRHPGYVGPG